MRCWTVLFALALAPVLGCGPSPSTVRMMQAKEARSAASAAPTPKTPDSVIVSVIGTNDVHGHITLLPVFGGYLDNLRKARQADGGAVLLLDGGDMFQGTLESNMGEGAAVVRAYNALGYAATTVGNHEFDFGPTGPDATPKSPDQDPQGALKARAQEAKFPFLSANLFDKATGKRVEWPNTQGSIVREVAGVKVGIIGVATSDTLRTTHASNVGKLQVEPLVPVITQEAKRLRAEGAQMIVVTAHAGGKCRDLKNPNAGMSCDNGEVLQTAAGLEPGLVDVIVAAHTHQGIAHKINGIAIIQSFAYGKAFGRVDVVVDSKTHKVKDVHIFAPQDICSKPAEERAECAPGSYEGAPVTANAEVLKVVEADEATAKPLREQSLGVTVKSKIRGSYNGESALGNLLADLMRESRPGVDVALLNGGGLRGDFPEGNLTYGEMFQTFPFDNRYAQAKFKAGALRQVFAENLGGSHGFLFVSGIRVQADCKGEKLEVKLFRQNGRPIGDNEVLTLLTSDYLATGEDSTLGRAEKVQPFVVEDQGIIREVLVDLLKKRGGTLDGQDPKIFNPEHPRIGFPGRRPVTCKK